MKASWLLGSQKCAIQAASVLLAAAVSVNAISFPIHGRQRMPESKLMKRMVNMTGSSSFRNSTVSVSDFGDVRYATNITLGGTVFEVDVDTGSTDLWVVGDVSETKNLSIPANYTYGAGAAVGYINTAELVFDDFTIPDQAYLHAVQADEFPATLLNTSLADSVGILGLGPSTNSNNRILLNGSRGDPVLDRIFRQNMSTPNFISILLPREANDNDFANMTVRQTQTGQLTIGEVVPGLEAIDNATKLPALADVVVDGEAFAFHWTTLLDSNGIIGPDGKRIQTPTGIKNPTNGSSDQLHVIFDTGFSLPQIPRDIADAIYGRIPGAEFQANAQGTGFWQIPCDYELNVTFIFGGVEFPVSPLDLNVVSQLDEDGNPVTCAAAYQQTAANIADPNGGFGALDAILGQAFLRNVYLLINFGDFVDGSNSSVADPFIQLLSTTNASSAHLDFVNQRLGGNDTTGSQPALLPVNQGQHSPGGNSTNSTSTNSTSTNGTNTNSTSGSDIESDSKSVASEELIGDDSRNDRDNDRHFYQRTWFIIMISVFGAIFLGVIVFIIVATLRRRRSNVRSEAVFVPQMVGPSAYAPLIGEQSVPGYVKHDPAWQGGYEEPQYGTDGKYGA